MTATKNLDVFIRDADGSSSCAHGSYILSSAFQPLLEPQPSGLVLCGYQGQVRIERNGDSYTPSEFLNAIDVRDMGALDCQIASLHLANARVFAGSRMKIHIPRSPRHFHTLPDMRADAERLKAQAIAAGLNPGSIVCELQMRVDGDIQRAALYAGHLRRAGFLIGIDDYMGEERDMQALREIRPSYVRYDAAWTADFLRHSAGIALFRVIQRQFREQNVLTIASNIDSDEALQVLERTGVTRLQGHAIARPKKAVDWMSGHRLQANERVGHASANTSRAAVAPVAAAGPALSQSVSSLAAQRIQPAYPMLRTVSEDGEREESLLRRMPPKRQAPIFGRRGLG